MRKLVAVVLLAGALGCGSVSPFAGYGKPALVTIGGPRPTAYVADALPAMGEFMRLHVGAGVSGVWPDEPALDNTYMLDIAGQVDIVMGLSVEVSVGWATFDYYDATLGSWGELSNMPVFGSVLWSFGAGNMKAYLGGGVQWEVTELKQLSGASADNAVGGHAVGGASLTQGRFSLQLEARYTWSDITIDYSNPVNSDITLADGMLYARLKFLLNF